MRIQLVFSPDCPNVDAARASLREALVACGLPAEWQEIDQTAPSGVALAGYGSPAVLVDGQDVAGAAAADEACCRVYRSADGTMRGAPDAALIVNALGGPRCRSWLPAWTGGLSLVAAVCPSLGLCPACWPAYVSVLSALGLPFAESFGRALPLMLLGLAVLPLMRLIVHRGAREAGFAVVTGALLIVESRVIASPALGAFGVLLVVLGALETMSRGVQPRPVLLQIGRR